ncbi:MAG: transketolase [Deltaproteobacteria bacterium]|nr:transketolase [Deltaproteobacteria bacterium]
MRRAFAEGLVQRAIEDPRVVFLTGDLGFQVFDQFKERFGPRYVNVGVAEAQMVCAAAGLAMEGWRPIAYSIASFATGRAFEQVRVSVSYPGLPVMLVGAGGGYTYSQSGVTHHAAEDLGLMSLLPGMTVVAPGDPGETAALMHQMLRLPGPSYLRIGKYGEPTYEAPGEIVLGRARLLQEGERMALLTTGDIAAAAVSALGRLRDEKINPLAYQFHTLKPLDTQALAMIARRVETIVVVEEHLPTGGLGASVGAWLAEQEDAPRMYRLGPPDALALGNLRREDLRRRQGTDAEGIYRLCRELWK